MLVVGIIVTSGFLVGGFGFIGPFPRDLGTKLAGEHFALGEAYKFGADQTYGIYATGSCAGNSADSGTLLGTLQGGGETISVFVARSQPKFSEHVGLGMPVVVQQCATFTTAHTATYTVTQVNAARTLVIVPSAALFDYWLYFASFYASVAMIVLGLCWLAWVLRRRHNGQDPTEQRDITHDPIALRAQENASPRWSN